MYPNPERTHHLTSPFTPTPLTLPPNTPGYPFSSPGLLIWDLQEIAANNCAEAIKQFNNTHYKALLFGSGGRGWGKVGAGGGAGKTKEGSQEELLLLLSKHVNALGHSAARNGVGMSCVCWITELYAYIAEILCGSVNLYLAPGSPLPQFILVRLAELVHEGDAILNGLEEINFAALKPRGLDEDWKAVDLERKLVYLIRKLGSLAHHWGSAFEQSSQPPKEDDVLYAWEVEITGRWDSETDYAHTQQKDLIVQEEAEKKEREAKEAEEKREREAKEAENKREQEAKEAQDNKEREAQKAEKKKETEAAEAEERERAEEHEVVDAEEAERRRQASLKTQVRDEPVVAEGSGSGSAAPAQVTKPHVVAKPHHLPSSAAAGVRKQKSDASSQRKKGSKAKKEVGSACCCQ
ncbi:hypothetical protein B9479_004694 [Cryptococcus floricola]|uniref:Uncharacterized protein n=1 Tax=Cryptococcus floricola TaxID=2591691 RepID=A0A5D3AX27_9TREE|nr:hypothetical protein B9479_004694 [Cryptococcus floricola]